MMPHRAITTSLLFVICFFAACQPVDPIHPYDEDSPLDAQATSDLTGSLVVPTGLAAETVVDVTVYLDPVNEESMSMSGSVDDSGIFLLENVLPGDYRMTAAGPGLAAGPILVTVPIGQVVDMGAVRMNPLLGQVRGNVYTLAGGPATGAVVSGDDGYQVTVVDTEGRFTLRTLGGERIVSVFLPNHGPWYSAPVEVVPGEDLTLENAVFLAPFPGIAVGQIGLRSYSTQVRQDGVSIKLTPIKAPEMDEEMAAAENDDEPRGGADDAAPNDDPASILAANVDVFRDTREPIANIQPDADGNFLVTDVPSGPYVLEVSATGYDTQTRHVVIRPSETTAIGLVELPHTATGTNAVTFEGRLRTGGVGLVAVTLTVNLVNNFGMTQLEFTRVITDSNGNFSFMASPDELYSVRAEITGFPDLVEGPFRWINGSGFVDPAGDRPDFNLGRAGP